MGDVVRTSYFLDGLCKKPGMAANITWVTTERAMPLLKHHPNISSLLTFEEIAAKKVRWEGQKFDWIISLDDEFKACTLLQGITWERLTGAYIGDNRVSYSEDASPWFDMGLISRLGKGKADLLKKFNQKTHDQILGGILGIEVSEPKFYNSPGASKIAGEILDGKAGHFVGLNLSAGTRWLNKRLAKGEAGLLAAKLVRAGFPVLIMGGTDDAEYNNWLSGQTGCRVLPLVSLDIYAAVVSQLKSIIAADTLGLHLAIAQRIPSVSFYAPTSAAEINTFGTGLKVVSTMPDYCNYMSSADNSTITAERLFEALLKLPDNCPRK